MKTVTKFSAHASPLILSILLGFLLHSVKSTKNYTELVYKMCSSEDFPDSASDSHVQALNSLFNDLVSHSLQKKFYKSTTGVKNTGVSGFYQCNGELTNEDCNICVNRLPDMSNTFCNRAMAAKIQLSGCALKYETNKFTKEKEQTLDVRARYEEEHKECSSERAEGEGFEEKRDSAFEELERGVVEHEGDSSVEREGFRAEAQCEESMEAGECAECVSRAAEIAKEECERSSSARVFLTRCSLSYDYEEYSRGEGDGEGGGEGYGRRRRGGEGYGGDYGGEGDGRRGEGGGEGGGEGYGYGGEGEHRDGYGEIRGQSTGRTLAIVLGGAAAALVIGFIFVMILKFGRKDDC